MGKLRNVEKLVFPRHAGQLAWRRKRRLAGAMGVRQPTQMFWILVLVGGGAWLVG